MEFSGQRENAAIEGSKDAIMSVGQSEKISIGYLPVSGQKRPRREGLTGGKIVRPEAVSWEPGNAIEQRKRLRRAHRAGVERRIRRDPDEPGLSDGAGTECGRRPPPEPLRRRSVVHMIGPCQRNQDIGVQEVRLHASSSAARVCSRVIGGASAGTEKQGKRRPSSVWGAGRTPLRTSSATASPSEIPLASATERIRSPTSSGRLIVVRIMMIVASRHQQR